MIRPALLGSALLLAACASHPPPSRSYRQPINYPPAPSSYSELKAPVPTPAPVADESAPNYLGVGLMAAVPAAAVGAKLAAGRAKAPLPAIEGPGVRPGLAAAETETAAASAAGAEGEAGMGLAARLRANSALRFMTGVGGEEVAGAAVAGGVTRFVLRGVIVPLLASVALWEFMQSK